MERFDLGGDEWPVIEPLRTEIRREPRRQEGRRVLKESPARFQSTRL